QHEVVEKLAERAQKEHEEMIALVNRLDNYIRRVNEIQEEIVNTKIRADDIHREFISYVDRIHELERKIVSLQEASHRRKKSEKMSSLHKEANEIFERFKRGEKLSTEDLMMLQKAGLI
ncbi:MAG: phosphoserine phosphatase, partial [Thermoplasmata archaeon]